MAKEINEQDIENIIRILDGYNAAEGSRLRLDVVEDEAAGDDGKIIDRKCHLGRCDICSPFDTGQAFDVIE